MFSCYGFLFKPFVSFLVAAFINGIIIRFMFHIHCITVHKLLYFSFSAFLCTAFLSAGIATSIGMLFFSSLFLLLYLTYMLLRLCLSVLLDFTTLYHLHVHTLVCVCLRACVRTRLSFRCLSMCTNFVSHEVLILCQNEASWGKMVNSFFMLFT